MNGFKQFLLRGNVVDLAVGVVVGAAFGTVVSALVKDLLTPLIAAVAKAGLFRVHLHDQWQQISVRRFPECRGLVRDRRRGHLLLCGAADQRPDGARSRTSPPTPPPRSARNA